MKVATIVFLRDAEVCTCSVEGSEMPRAWVCDAKSLGLQGRLPERSFSCRERAGGESPRPGHSHGIDVQDSGARGSHFETSRSETWGMEEKDGF